ncbi:DUF6299 family protein [Streptomyces antimicrobicus]|uniref:DUF6299 family protein n=1 Tax=Streptomyces antimicrobicus TaxID=2883108 RepID=A0ABS8BC89_9ACTN|nr:DUF6299 family protein [Streptomyces antimicrobicus]MCB5182249.1 DUF6299 family protein [Streptomyces antimicrobicus]
MRISPSRLTAATLSALATAAVFATPAGAGAFGNEISVSPYGTISDAGAVTLHGTYRCTPGSPHGVQIQAAVLQDSTRVGFGGEEAVCDGEQHKWSATGSLEWTRVHEGPAGAEVRLQSAALGSGFTVRVTYLAESHRDVVLKKSHR